MLGRAPTLACCFFRVVQDGGLLLENEVIQNNEQGKIYVCHLCVGGMMSGEGRAVTIQAYVLTTTV